MTGDDLKVKRYPDRAVYDKTELMRILGDNMFCNVSFISGNIPFSIPMMYSSREMSVYLHGSPDSRLINFIKSGGTFSIEIVKIRGLVLATHIKDNSVNYESAVAIGKGMEVQDLEEKSDSFMALCEKIAGGMWDYYHQPSDDDLRHVSVIKIDIEDFSVKIRKGGPKEDNPDGGLWTGTLDLECHYSNPTAYGKFSGDLPDFLKSILRGK